MWVGVTEAIFVDSLKPFHSPFYGGVAQSVEHRIHKPSVTGSIPVAAITTHTLLPTLHLFPDCSSPVQGADALYSLLLD